MNLFANPRATAFAVSTALFVLQLVAFGSSADDAMVAGDCPEPATPSAIILPPLAPEPPGLNPGIGETSPVSI